LVSVTRLKWAETWEPGRRLLSREDPSLYVSDYVLDFAERTIVWELPRGPDLLDLDGHGRRLLQRISRGECRGQYPLGDVRPLQRPSPDRTRSRSATSRLHRDAERDSEPAVRRLRQDLQPRPDRREWRVDCRLPEREPRIAARACGRPIHRHGRIVEPNPERRCDQPARGSDA